MTSLECKFIPLHSSLRAALLPDCEEVIAGRNKTFGITNLFCSRRQLSLLADYKSQTVTITNIGASSARVDDKELLKGESVTAKNGSIIEVIIDSLKYQIKFVNKSKRPREPSEESSHKMAKCSQFIWECHCNNEVLFCRTSGFDDNRIKIASFDLDRTLITTKSGRVFPINCDDWKLWHVKVKETLLKLHQEDWKIIIFTNQANLCTPKGKIQIDNFKKKIENILLDLEIPASVYISTSLGYYRKPCPGMWELMKSKASVENISLESFYCGDAAGRPANWKPGYKADFAVSDRLFATNIGIKFFTPEELFLNERPVGFIINFHPDIIEDSEPFTFVPSKKQEVIVMAGSPASGKSNFVNTYILSSGYKCVSRDTLGSWQKCVAHLKKLLADGYSVVVDNTNPDIESRRRYVEVCQEINIPVRCIFMTTSLNRCLHNNKFREITDRNHELVAPAIIKNFHKNFQYPTLEEGFCEIIGAPFFPSFKNPELKKIYFYHLLSH